MRKQNLQKELSPIFDNESIKIGTFKANRSIDTLKISSFGKAMTDTSYLINRLNACIITAPGHKINTPELIKFVREHANDYDTVPRKEVPSCISIVRNSRSQNRYFSVFIEKFGEISFKGFPFASKIIFERMMKVIRVLRRILTDSDFIDLYGLYCEFYKNI